MPNLYDLGPDHTGRLFLESVKGDMVVLSWLYPRAAFWLLDRSGIKGHFGETKLKPPADDDDEGEAEDDTPVEKPEAIGAAGAIPDRHIYTLDLRDSNKYEAYVAEIKRITAECRDRRDAKARAKAVNSPAIIQLGLSLAKPEPELEEVPAAQRALERRDVARRPPLVPGDRLQPLHELPGVLGFLLVRRVRRRFD